MIALGYERHVSPGKHCFKWVFDDNRARRRAEDLAENERIGALAARGYDESTHG